MKDIKLTEEKYNFPYIGEVNIYKKEIGGEVSFFIRYDKKEIQADSTHLPIVREEMINAIQQDIRQKKRKLETELREIKQFPRIICPISLDKYQTPNVNSGEGEN